MFGDKECPFCEKKIKSDFHFCPYCGEKVRKVEVRRPYDIFEDVEKEFERIDKMFGPSFIKFPRIKPFRGGGISITIRSGTGMKPEVDIKTSGEYKKLEPEIKRKLGVREGIREVEEEKLERKPRIPKITEEPETKIERIGNREIISIKLPEVKRSEDIEIKKLEQSLEVKAFSDDKAYFKLIPTKPNVQISEKSFVDGILKIELIG
ncbi:MAG: zinc ribbon domain-containing protein [Candidatus Aenigmarchaeota archaeon]|nr:zinc ribbon domain-containing protein [Candidatus Aenigmarchaeota archaeon]